MERAPQKLGERPLPQTPWGKERTTRGSGGENSLPGVSASRAPLQQQTALMRCAGGCYGRVGGCVAQGERPLPLTPWQPGDKPCSGQPSAGRGGGITRGSGGENSLPGVPARHAPPQQQTALLRCAGATTRGSGGENSLPGVSARRAPSEQQIALMRCSRERRRALGGRGCCVVQGERPLPLTPWQPSAGQAAPSPTASGAGSTYAAACCASRRRARALSAREPTRLRTASMSPERSSAATRSRLPVCRTVYS